MMFFSISLRLVKRHAGKQIPKSKLNNEKHVTNNEKLRIRIHNTLGH